MADQLLRGQVAMMQLQLSQQKTLMRDAGIKAEIMRHKSPQIKVVLYIFYFLFIFFYFLKNKIKF